MPRGSPARRPTPACGGSAWSGAAPGCSSRARRRTGRWSCCTAGSATRSSGRPLFGLLALTRRVLAIDRPGHGLADPFEYRAGVDLLAHARMPLRETLDALGLERARPRGQLDGRSGGRSSSRCASPTRLGSLVLVGAPLGASRGVPFMLRAGSLAGASPRISALPRLKRPTPGGARSFFELLVAHPERLDPAFLDAAVASQRRNVGTWLGLLDLAVGPRGIAPHLLMSRSLAGAWAVPTTLVWGERDAFFYFTPIEVGAAIAAAHLRVARSSVSWTPATPRGSDDPRRVADAIEARRNVGRRA